MLTQQIWLPGYQEIQEAQSVLTQSNRQASTTHPLCNDIPLDSLLHQKQRWKTRAVKTSAKENLSDLSEASQSHK